VTGRTAVDQGDFGAKQRPDSGTQSASALREALEAMDEELRQLQRLHREPLPADAVALANIERRLHECGRGQPGQDAAGDDSRGVTAELENWKEVCDRLGLAAVVEQIDRILRSHTDRVVERWKAFVAPDLADPSAEVCFQHLMQTTALQLEHQGSASDSELETFEEVRHSLREALREAVRRHPADAKVQQAWATQLLDAGAIVMTAVDDLAPEVAAQQILIVARDCDWHAKSIATSSGHRRRLRRKVRRLQAEHQERVLQNQLEARFGRRIVGTSERVVLVLIFVVIALMMIEMFFDLAPQTIFVFSIIDAAACVVFLTEFFTKLSMVPGKWLWFRRHFLIDFVPSIPFALLTGGLTAVNPADSVRLGRLARLLRLPRLARYVRILRPIIRVLRGVGLLVRGVDRLARRYGHLLNQNVILYPTRAELDRYRSSRPIGQVHVGKLHADLNLCWNQFLASAADIHQEQIAGTRLEVLGNALAESDETAKVNMSTNAAQTREIPASFLIHRLRTATPHDLELVLAEPLLAQLARIVRIYSRPPFRWLPIVSRCAPNVTRDMTDGEVTSAASRRVATLLQKYHDAWFWFADLYGTVTPSQFVDRIGTMLVKSSMRPAYRLALFGGFLLLTQLALYVTALTMLKPLEEFLGRFVGTPVLVLGGVCVFVLAVGLWLKSLAQEATEFYEQSAQAQYLSLMETVRNRALERDSKILFDRVLRPELLIRGDFNPSDRDQQIELFRTRIRQSLLGDRMTDDTPAPFAGLEIVTLLYRDALDGALLTESDTRATSQLLGNPAVRQFVSLSERFTAKEIKSLQKLDLVRQKSLLGGPYLWFNFISRSIAHSVANLLVDYNQNAIPLSERSQLTPEDRQRYEQWLADDSSSSSSTPGTSEKSEQQVERNYVTTAFTAVHFLDAYQPRDEEIAASFGPEVLSRLRKDRRQLIRRIFGTYPMHSRPKEQRVVNLYSIYSSWFAGGRVLLMPVFLLLVALQFAGALLMWIGRSIQEIRRPELRRPNDDAAKAHFASAVRKIERIRGPVVNASMKLRARMDPEYLGVALPGLDHLDLRRANCDADVAFLNPDPDLVTDLEQQRARARSDMNRLERLIDDGLLQRVAASLNLPPDALTSREHVQALAVSYLADFRKVRRQLAPTEVLDDAYRMAATLPLLPGRWFPHLRLKRMFSRYWSQHGFGDRQSRRAAWRATLNNFWGAADALRTWHVTGNTSQAEGEQTLGRLLVHPGRITQQLATLRAIQTIAVLDVLHYREHVYHLGSYADMGDSPQDLLTWDTVLPE
jgi:hypothetical protein